MTHDEVLAIVQAEVRRALEALRDEFKKADWPGTGSVFANVSASLYPPTPKPEIEVVESLCCAGSFVVVRGEREYHDRSNQWLSRKGGTDFAANDIALAVRDVLRKRETAYSSANGNTINQ